MAAAEAFEVAVQTETTQAFHSERDQNEAMPCSQRKEDIMGRLLLFAEPNKDFPQKALLLHTPRSLAVCMLFLFSSF